MNFKKITKEQLSVAKAKFMEHGQGINMNPHIIHSPVGAATWHDLIDTKQYHESSIIQRMKGIAKDMVISCDDPMLEGTSVLFTFKTEIDEIVKYTHEDAYLFLRASLMHRRSTKDYREKKTKIEELTKFVEENRTLKEKRKDAAAQLEQLQKSL